MDLIKGHAAQTETNAYELAETQRIQPTEKQILTLTDWEMAMAGGGESFPCWG